MKPETSQQQRKALASYISGFVLSLLLTGVAYNLATHSGLRGWGLGYAVLALAAVQLIVQLVCFLHLGQEREPRWKLLVFDFTLIILVIVIIGTLWIMQHLNYHMMNMGSNDTNRYLQEHEGL